MSIAWENSSINDAKKTRVHEEEEEEEEEEEAYQDSRIRFTRTTP